MGWGNTSRPMMPMTRRNQFQRRQFAWTTLASNAGIMTSGTAIIRAALDGHPDQVDLSYHPALTAGCEPLWGDDAGPIEMV